MNFRMVILLLMESLGGCFGLGVSENIVCGSSIPTYVCLPRNYSSMDIPLTDEPNHIGKLYIQWRDPYFFHRIPTWQNILVFFFQGIEIHISDVLKINDRDFSITFSLYFNVQWREPRLHIDPSFFQNR